MVGGGGEKIIKGRKEVFSERLEGEQGLGGDMENKQTRQQTARRGGEGGHKASFVSVLAAALAAAIKKKKSLERRGWMDDGMEG